MILNPQLQRTIKLLRLSGILDTLPARLQQSVDGNVSHLQFLELLLADEMDRRKDRLLKRRTKSARLNPLWTLDAFDWTFNPKIPKAKILDLASSRFILQRHNAIFIGPPGTGKSHLAHALGFAAIHAGYLVATYPVYEVTEMILEASQTGERKELFAKLLKPDLLILDDLGMKRLHAEMAEDLLEIIMKRYEKKSTILTSNRPSTTGPRSLEMRQPPPHSWTGSCTMPLLSLFRGEVTDWTVYSRITKKRSCRIQYERLKSIGEG